MAVWVVQVNNMQRKCNQCGKLFTTISARFCDDCKREREKVSFANSFEGELRTVTCGVCGTEFTTRKKAKKYCSKECAAEKQREHSRMWKLKDKIDDTTQVEQTPCNTKQENVVIDMVNHPPHYILPSGKESIDLLREILTEEEFRGWCKGSAYKYMFRAGKKDPSKIKEDYDKAGFFLKELGKLKG